MSALITCSHVDFGYEHHDAVVDLTMEVEEGDYLCVVGANGAGKSTLAKGLLGLLAPTGGTIRMADELKKTGIGYLPQQTAAQKDFPATVREVVLSEGEGGFSIPGRKRRWQSGPWSGLGSWILRGGASGSFPGGSSSECLLPGLCAQRERC